jgi:zinc and cadmium transporter
MAVSSLAWILTATLLGAGLSVAAAVLAAREQPALVAVLISYAIGTLLGAAFLEVLPSALARSGEPAEVTGAVLGGLLLFFVLEKLMLWRHRHGESIATQDARARRNHAQTVTLIVVGDTFRNFVDGLIMAAAFLVSLPLGAAAALALISHEIPQQIGDFATVLASGRSERTALACSLLSGAMMVLGGWVGFCVLQAVPAAVPMVLSIAAGSMLYVAVADLIPGLVRRHELSATAQQMLLIGAGVATIWIVGVLVRGTAAAAAP